jgi:predicted transcriptional regulator YdeE
MKGVFTIHYNSEFMAYLDLKQYGDKEQVTSLFVASNMILLKKDDNINVLSDVIIGDYYITAKHMTNAESDMDTISVFSRGHGDKLYTINIPRNYSTHEIKGKWALLAKVSQELWCEERNEEYYFDFIVDFESYYRDNPEGTYGKYSPAVMSYAFD